MIELGSEFYFAGQHWKVTERTRRDGTPAVRIKRTVFSARFPETRRSARGIVICESNLERHGVRREATA